MYDKLDPLYLNWLQSLVIIENSPTYNALMSQLFRTKFEYYIAHDENRASDGKDLRYIFVQEASAQPSLEWLELDCSMLEMLIALAKRMAFQTDLNIDECFWIMLENVGLRSCIDNASYDAEYVKNILDNINLRRYYYNGEGGLFPLQKAERDQLEVELLYQMYAYVIENY